MYTVYKHTAPNGKVYIGITGRKPDVRWRNGEGYKNNKHLYRAIQKYTWKNFKHDILETGLTKEQACDLEIQLIAKYHATDPRYGYNISIGGECGSLGLHPSDETRRKMSESHKRVYRDPDMRRKMSESVKRAYRNPEVRRKISESVKRAYLNPEYRRKICEASKGANNPMHGKHHSPEARRKISESHKGKAGYWKGKHLSAETRKKLSEANKGKQLSPDTRRKIGESLKGRPHLSPEARKKLIELNKKSVICVETGTLYSSVAEAAESIGLTASAISNVLRGTHKTSGGYHWKYAD